MHLIYIYKLIMQSICCEGLSEIVLGIEEDAYVSQRKTNQPIKQENKQQQTHFKQTKPSQIQIQYLLAAPEVRVR